MKRLMIALLILITIFSLTCGGQAAQEKVLRVGKNLKEIENLDIHLSGYNTVFEISNIVCEPLMGLETETLDLYPLLLTKMPDVSKDGLTYMCELKKGIKFHDGTELTSEDVVYTFNRFFDPKTSCLNVFLATMIEGSKEFLASERDHLTGIEAIDRYHFTLKLYYPYSAFSAILAIPPLEIYPKDACEAAGDRWGLDTLIGTGPYKLDTFEPKSKIVFSKFEDYHGGAKNYDKIVFSDMDKNTALLEFEAGNIDLCDVDTQLVDTYLDNPDYKDNVKSQEFVGIFTLIFNQDLEPLNNLKVREAISLATDRETLCATYFRGRVRPAKSLLPKGIPGYDESLPELEYNPEKAKELLVEAGYPDGIEITATVPGDDALFVGIWEVLQQQYTKANITLKIEKVDRGAWVDKKATGNTQLYILDYYADYIDPDNFLYNMCHSLSEDLMSTGNKDPKFDALAEQGRLINDLAEKQKFYADLEYYLTREKFVEAPLYVPSGYYLVSDRLTGLVLKKNFLYQYVDGDIIE